MYGKLNVMNKSTVRPTKDATEDLSPPSRVKKVVSLSFSRSSSAAPCWDEPGSATASPARLPKMTWLRILDQSWLFPLCKGKYPRLGDFYGQQHGAGRGLDQIFWTLQDGLNIGNTKFFFFFFYIIVCKVGNIIFYHGAASEDHQRGIQAETPSGDGLGPSKHWFFLGRRIKIYTAQYCGFGTVSCFHCV